MKNLRDKVYTEELLKANDVKEAVLELQRRYKCFHDSYIQDDSLPELELWIEEIFGDWSK